MYDTNARTLLFALFVDILAARVEDGRDRTQIEPMQPMHCEDNCISRRSMSASGVTTSEAPWGKHFRRPPLPQGMSVFWKMTGWIVALLRHGQDRVWQAFC